MRLKRLELFGFKSFADRTVFEFGVNTLTGVVGPNGCGKSNVVDSVRWVLGEQRPTSMRGAEMTDVIFKGSASRPALSVAEVTLILDNEQGELDGRGPEVAITRRVFKSGEGEYLLDGDKVRLKDIREMLFDTGLGSRGYSVLEQGKIDAVLSANPLERRRIFEEAAGISRYRQRKVETEMRLKRVADDMTRLDDVLGELSTRVRSLKIQAGKAERFVEARAEWTRERTRALRQRALRLDRDLGALALEIAGADGRVLALREQRTTSEADVESRERERASLVAEVERLVQEASRLAGDGRALDERRAQLSSRVASAEVGAREEGGRAQVLEAALLEREREHGELALHLQHIEGEVARASETAAARTQALRDLERAMRDGRTSEERQNEIVLGFLHERTQAENRARQLADSRGPATERRERTAERLAAARSAVEAMRAESESAGTRVADAETAQSEKDQLRRTLAQTMADVAAEATAAEREKNRLELERARVQSRIEFLLDRERDLEELSKDARRLLEGVETQAGGPCAPEELCGLAADHLRTDTVHARALDAVLGSRGSALVVRDPEAAQKIAAWLKAGSAGQVGLLLAHGVAERPSVHAPLASEEEALVTGYLSAHVTSDPGYERLAALLSGAVLVARDLESAFALVARRPDLACVTLEGELVDAAGILAGARALTQGAVGRRSSAAELAHEVEAHAAAIAELEQRRGELAATRHALQKDWERSSQELEARRQARAQAESALGVARARLRDLEAAERALVQEGAAASEELLRIERSHAESEARHVAAQESFERENARLEELALARRALEERRAEVARDEGRAQVEAARVRAEHEGLVRRVRDLERVCGENRAEHARAARLSGEQAEAARSGALEVERLALESSRALAERAAVEERLAELRRVAEGGREAVESLRRRVESVTRELEATAESLSARRLEHQRLALARAEVVARAQEDLGLDADALSAGVEPEPELAEAAALDAFDAHVRELKTRLDKLGPVNMEAMSELDEVGTRLEFLQSQRQDLARSRAALEAAIETIDAESKRLFVEAFESVRTNFQRIFRQLFGGGRADVTLEEGVDVLEAGVEIVARPPGRELLSIGLLSGGQRTLTALALLFAVFQARPSPFCILDEVDAALDDANVDRFLGMLDGFRAHTQFVVVTHNKGTMSACEGLYGVTMETKGVSRQVSVELSEVDTWAQRAGPPRSEAVPAVANGRPVHPGLDLESGEPVVELVPRSANGRSENAARRAQPTSEAEEVAEPEKLAEA